MKKKMLIVACLLSACGAIGPQASMSLSKYRSFAFPAEGCALAATIMNQKDWVYNGIRPQVRILVLDSGGNTLDERTIEFDLIREGTSQTKEVSIRKTCVFISKVEVVGAWSYYGPQNYEHLIGVRGLIFSWDR